MIESKDDVEEGIPSEFLGEDTSEFVNVEEEIDSGVILMRIFERVSQMDVMLKTIETRQSAIEKNVAYLLSRDPQYMEAVEKMSKALAESGDGLQET
jgi:hypothetical protein